MKFEGQFYLRSSVQTGQIAPGERAILALNPDRRTRICEATGWVDLYLGTLNLRVDKVDYDALLAMNPVLIEQGSAILYPEPYKRIPIARGEYYYYLATASFLGKSCEVMARRVKFPPFGSTPVELFAPVNLTDFFGLKKGDRVIVDCA
jgi:CTP-dependent riboflavin kinase